MISRFIRSSEVEEVVKYGTIIKIYTNDKPYMSNLMLKFVNNRRWHVVIAQNPETMECIIITCYQPDIDKWDPDFKEKMIPL